MNVRDDVGEGMEHAIPKLQEYGYAENWCYDTSEEED